MLSKARFFCVGSVLIILMISSCKPVYYIGETVQEIKCYNWKDNTMPVAYIIPKATKVLVRGRRSEYSYIFYEKFEGYAYEALFTGFHRYKPQVDGYSWGYSSGKRRSASASGPSSSGGTVNVRGYYRKDGTYVRPHTRSAPKRKS